MSSTVIAKNIQIGTSGTATNNFNWYQPASPDGTVRLGVGNYGATTLDAVTVSNSGNVTVSGSVTGGALSGSSLAVSGATTTGSLTVNSNAISAVNSLGFRNRILNGDCRIDQRNAGASVTANDNVFPVDRFKIVATQTSKGTAQRNAGSVTPPSGFVNYLGFTSSSAYSVLTGDAFALRQSIEGFNVSDLGWGTASAQSVTVSFWVRSSLTGSFGGNIANSAFNRSYPFSYTINASNTWEYKTVTIPGDTTGTWLTDNNIGIALTFGLGYGASLSATANAWNAGTGYMPTGATSIVGTNGATFYITGVQLEAGTVASPFERRPFGTELHLCKRYFETSYNYGTAVGSVTVDGNVLWLTSQQWGVTSVPNGPIVQGSVVCEVAKRAVATVVGYSPNTGTAGRFVLGSSGLDVAYIAWLQQAPSTRHIGYPQNAGGGAFGNTDSVRFHWTSSAEL